MKRNVLNELEPLRFAGLVKSFRAANSDRYALARREQLMALVGPVPERSTRWIPTFHVLHIFLDLTRGSGSRSELENAVQAARLVEQRRELFAAAEMFPPPLPRGTTAWSTFLSWTIGQVKAIARV